MSVADPVGFHGFPVTPLSKQSTADYVARKLLSYYTFWVLYTIVVVFVTNKTEC